MSVEFIRAAREAIEQDNIMSDTTKDAVPTQTLDEQAATLQRVYDLVGMGALARTPGILLANLENMKRRSDCLSGIEQLFAYEIPDDDMPGEMIDECDLNWGHDRAEYVETFKAAFPAFIARNPELAPAQVQAEAVGVDDPRKAIAKSVFGGINALRWLLNITTEFDRKDVRTRQAARLLDDYCSGNGISNRAHLECLWKTLNDELSLEDTLECLSVHAPSTGDQS